MFNENKEDKLITLSRVIKNTLKKKGYIISITIFTIFGGIIAYLSTLRNIYGSVWGPLLLGICLIISVLLLFSLHQSVSEIQNLRQNINNISSLPYKRILSEFNYEIQPDGTKIAINKDRIEALIDTVDVVYRKTLLSADNTFKKYNSSIQLLDGPPGIHINKIDKFLTPQRLERAIRFTPPLKKGQIIELVIKESNKEIHMDLESILVHFEAGNWIIDEPLECRAFTIRCPTDILVCRINFPKGYPIEDACTDVYHAGSKLRHIFEFERIAEGGYFIQNEQDNKQILTLKVPRPHVGLTYALKWKPPSSEIYNNFLKETKG